MQGAILRSDRFDEFHRTWIDSFVPRTMASNSGGIIVSTPRRISPSTIIYCIISYNNIQKQLHLNQPPRYPSLEERIFDRTSRSYCEAIPSNMTVCNWVRFRWCIVPVCAALEQLSKFPTPPVYFPAPQPFYCAPWGMHRAVEVKNKDETTETQIC